MSRPILTKKIKRKDTVYNLELWNPANDRVPDKYYEPQQPNFRKEFFNDVDMSSTWPDATKYQERFDLSLIHI